MFDNLIARLEKATGPDRELDAAIACAITPIVKTDDDLTYTRQRERDGSDTTIPGHYFIVSRSGAQARTAPYYTQSVDTALTLLKEDQWYCVSGPHSVAGGIYLGGPKRFDVVLNIRNAWEGIAPTPAIAICIAALKAFR